MNVVNINPLIENAFENYRLPIAYKTYKGKEKSYLTYYTWSQRPDNYYDDESHTTIAYGTIDIYSSGNFKNILNEVIEILEQNDFTVTDIESEDYEEDSKLYHVPINFYKEG